MTERITDQEIERMERLADLLAVYGRIDLQPTHDELWAGCKDAAPVIRTLIARLAEAEALLERALQENMELGTIESDIRAYLGGEEKV